MKKTKAMASKKNSVKKPLDKTVKKAEPFSEKSG